MTKGRAFNQNQESSIMDAAVGDFGGGDCDGVCFLVEALVMLGSVPMVVLLVAIAGRRVREHSKVAQDALADSGVVIEESVQAAEEAVPGFPSLARQTAAIRGIKGMVFTGFSNGVEV
jgi:hypothetical protein